MANKNEGILEATDQLAGGVHRVHASLDPSPSASTCAREKKKKGKERKQPTSGPGTAEPKGATTCRIDVNAHSSDVVVTFLLVSACHTRGAQTRCYAQTRTCALATRDPLVTQAAKTAPEPRNAQYRASQPAFPYGHIKWHQTILFLVVIEARASIAPSDQLSLISVSEREHWFSRGPI